jgi:hypothetical protein
MKKFLPITFLSLLFLFSAKGFSQNVMVNIVTQNSGIVKIDSSIFLEIKISNTSAISEVEPFRLRPQISFPSNMVLIPVTGHVLPNGWNILSNENAVISLSNGTDIIEQNQNRTILIALKGKTIGGPSRVIANLFFSNGVTPGSVSGTSLKGDNTADNSSTSSIEVTK